MKRITPDDVKAAYARTGLVPCVRFTLSCDGKSACGLGAIYADRYGRQSLEPREPRGGLTTIILDRLESIYGLAYIHGFWCGFDGHTTPHLPSFNAARRDEETAGQIDGLACAEAVGLRPAGTENQR